MVLETAQNICSHFLMKKKKHLETLFVIFFGVFSINYPSDNDYLLAM